MKPTLVVTFDVGRVGREVVGEVIGEVADIVFLTEVKAADRATVLLRAEVLFARNTATDLTPDERELIAGARLLQFYTAGVDFIPLLDLPAELPIASNGGAFAEPMAEHALAMALSAAKRLPIEQRHLAVGKFNQFTPNRMLSGRVYGIFGFGGIDVATARLMRAVGMTMHAINRRGHAVGSTEWIGTPDQLDELLRACDVLVIAAPLSRATEKGLRHRHPNALWPFGAAASASGQRADAQASCTAPTTPCHDPVVRSKTWRSSQPGPHGMLWPVPVILCRANGLRQSWMRCARYCRAESASDQEHFGGAATARWATRG